MKSHKFYKTPFFIELDINGKTRSLVNNSKNGFSCGHENGQGFIKEQNENIFMIHQKFRLSKKSATNN